MHEKIVQALEEIDAAVMSSDTFSDPASRAELLSYIGRWIDNTADDTAEDMDPSG